MNSQAAGLQALARGEAISTERLRFEAPLLVVTGGKGGVGKTSVTANLAVALSGMGCRTLAADLDLGLANLDVFFRLTPRRHLGAVASGERAAKECLLEGPNGLSILPAPSGVEEMASLGEEARRRVLRGLASVSANYDLILADSAAGIAPDVLAFAAAAQRVLLVTTPEPAALTDVYALLKLLLRRNPQLNSGLLVNGAADLAEASAASKKIQLVSERFLGCVPKDMGWIPKDACVPRANREQRPFVSAYPDALAAASVRQLARRVCEWALSK